MKALIYIPIKDAVKGTVQAASEWYTTTDQLSHSKIKSLVQVIVDSDQLQNMVDGKGWSYKDTEVNGQRIFERNPDTGQIRSRKPGDYGNEEMIKMNEEMMANPLLPNADRGDEDMDEGESRDEQWYVDQYNRNRHHSEQVKSIGEILKK